MLTTLARLEKMVRDTLRYRELDYIERQQLIRKLFTIPFFAAFPLFLAAGVLARTARAAGGLFYGKGRFR